jgi:hypothetical protein
MQHCQVYRATVASIVIDHRWPSTTSHRQLPLCQAIAWLFYSPLSARDTNNVSFAFSLPAGHTKRDGHPLVPGYYELKKEYKRRCAASCPPSPSHPVCTPIEDPAPDKTPAPGHSAASGQPYCASRPQAAQHTPSRASQQPATAPGPTPDLTQTVQPPPNARQAPLAASPASAEALPTCPPPPGRASGCWGAGYSSLAGSYPLACKRPPCRILTQSWHQYALPSCV